MKQAFTILCMILMLGVLNVDAAKKVTIKTQPETAKIYIDGQLVGTGSYEVKFTKGNDFYVIKVEAPGYLTRSYRLLKTYTQSTALYSLPEDDALAASYGSEDGGGEFANKWHEITCRKGLTEDKVWKRLISVCTNYFDNIEVKDKTAGWIKTEWHTTKFRYQTVRTRLEVRMSFIDDDVLSYKVRLSSEIKDNDCTKGNNCYSSYDRVLKKYEPMIQELNTVVGSNL